MNSQQHSCIAINPARITHRPDSVEPMLRVGRGACITTASHPGFPGFGQQLRVGIRPLTRRCRPGGTHKARRTTGGSGQTPTPRTPAPGPAPKTA